MFVGWRRCFDDSRFGDLRLGDHRFVDAEDAWAYVSTELLELKERPIIVVHTSVIEPRLVKDLKLRGVDEIVFKPTDYTAFAVKMKELVEGRRCGSTFR